MAVDENAWKIRLAESDKKPSNESPPPSTGRVFTGTKPDNKDVGNVPGSDQKHSIVVDKEDIKMEVDIPEDETKQKSESPTATTPQLISQNISPKIASPEISSISDKFVASPLLPPPQQQQIGKPAELFRLQPSTSPSRTEISFDMNEGGRHPAIYAERTQLPIFSRVNIQNPIHVTKLSTHQTSIQEEKLYAMAPAIFFDRKTSDEEYFYLYYISDTGIITRMRGSYASRRLLDEHVVYFPFPINHQTIEVPDTINRMPPSCRFLDNGRVVYADGVGKLTCFLAEREFPFRWIHQMTFYLPLNSDNVGVYFDVQQVMNQRPGLPFIITDARVRENITEVVLIASVRRKPEKVGKTSKTLVMYSKIYWLTIGKKDGEAITRLLRQRIYECDESVDYVSLDPQCVYLIFSSTTKPKFVYDSNRPTTTNSRELVRYIPNEYPFTYIQDQTAVTVKMEFSYFITENFLEVLFDEYSFCVKYRGATLFRASLFAKIIPARCDYNRENLFGQNRATTNLIIRLVKNAPGEWDHFLTKYLLNIEPTSYYDHHFVKDVKEEEHSKLAVISWILGSSGEIAQYTKLPEGAVYGGGQIHQSLCVANKQDAKLILFSNDKGYKDYATIENFMDVKNSVTNIRFSSCAPSGRYFVHVDDKNKIYLYTWKRQSAEFRENQHVVGEKFVFDLGRYVEKYHEYPAEDKEIICVLALEKMLIFATRNAFFFTSDI
uniref:CNH domain-containing protein n=1 Tax=Panagrolaimus superbus TaxID=310955 RepID=A0A914YY01_9BILA